MSSPFTSGFRAVLRDPVTLLIEVAWRWCFGAVAVAILFLGWRMALGTVPVSAADRNAWQSHDAYRMAMAGIDMMVDAGAKLASVGMAVLPAVSVLWVLIGAAGRTLTMRRIAPGRPIRFRSILVLHLWRALVAWVTLAAIVAAVTGAALVANRGPQPDYVMYYAIALPLLFAAAIFWSVVNWFLTTAAAWVGKDMAGKSAGASLAMRMAMGFTATHRGDMAGLNVVFALLRLVAIAVAFVLCALPVGLAGGSPSGYTGWVVAVSLCYFVFADFTHVSRLAAYVQMGEGAIGTPVNRAHPEGTKTPQQPVET